VREHRREDRDRMDAGCAAPRTIRRAGGSSCRARARWEG
jgi:hypothetical protein